MSWLIIRRSPRRASRPIVDYLHQCVDCSRAAELEATGNNVPIGSGQAKIVIVTLPQPRYNNFTNDPAGDRQRPRRALACAVRVHGGPRRDYRQLPERCHSPPAARTIDRAAEFEMSAVPR